MQNKNFIYYEFIFEIIEKSRIFYLFSHVKLLFIDNSFVSNQEITLK